MPMFLWDLIVILTCFVAGDRAYWSGDSQVTRLCVIRVDYLNRVKVEFICNFSCIPKLFQRKEQMQHSNSDLVLGYSVTIERISHSVLTKETTTRPRPHVLYTHKTDQK